MQRHLYVIFSFSGISLNFLFVWISVHLALHFFTKCWLILLWKFICFGCLVFFPLASNRNCSAFDGNRIRRLCKQPFTMLNAIFAFRVSVSVCRFYFFHSFHLPAMMIRRDFSVCKTTYVASSFMRLTFRRVFIIHTPWLHTFNFKLNLSNVERQCLPIVIKRAENSSVHGGWKRLGFLMWKNDLERATGEES